MPTDSPPFQDALNTCAVQCKTQAVSGSDHDDGQDRCDLLDAATLLYVSQSQLLALLSVHAALDLHMTSTTNSIWSNDRHEELSQQVFRGLLVVVEQPTHGTHGADLSAYPLLRHVHGVEWGPGSTTAMQRAGGREWLLEAASAAAGAGSRSRCELGQVTLRLGDRVWVLAGDVSKASKLSSFPDAEFRRMAAQLHWLCCRGQAEDWTRSEVAARSCSLEHVLKEAVPLATELTRLCRPGSGASEQSVAAVFGQCAPVSLSLQAERDELYERIFTVISREVPCGGRMDAVLACLCAWDAYQHAMLVAAHSAWLLQARGTKPETEPRALQADPAGLNNPSLCSQVDAATAEAAAGAGAAVAAESSAMMQPCDISPKAEREDKGQNRGGQRAVSGAGPSTSPAGPCLSPRLVAMADQYDQELGRWMISLPTMNGQERVNICDVHRVEHLRLPKDLLDVFLTPADYYKARAGKFYWFYPRLSKLGKLWAVPASGKSGQPPSSPAPQAEVRQKRRLYPDPLDVQRFHPSAVAGAGGSGGDGGGGKGATSCHPQPDSDSRLAMMADRYDGQLGRRLAKLHAQGRTRWTHMDDIRYIGIGIPGELVDWYGSPSRYLSIRSGRHFQFLVGPGVLAAMVGDAADEDGDPEQPDRPDAKRGDKPGAEQGGRPVAEQGACPREMGPRELHVASGRDRSSGAAVLRPPWLPGEPNGQLPWAARLNQQGRVADPWMLYHADPVMWRNLILCLAQLGRQGGDPRAGPAPPKLKDVTTSLSSAFGPYVTAAQAHAGNRKDGVRRFLMDNLDPVRMGEMGATEGQGPYEVLLEPALAWAVKGLKVPWWSWNEWH